MISQINLLINIATFINSFCLLYTSNLASSTFLSRKVQNEWGSCDNQTFVCNFAICLPVLKVFFHQQTEMTKFEIKWLLSEPLYLKCAALLGPFMLIASNKNAYYRMLLVADINISQVSVATLKG